MWREDWEARVIEILTKSAEQADLYADSAAHVTSESAAELCRKLSARRRDLSSALETALRTKGRLPKEIDPEREAADRWFANLRSSLTGHEDESLLGYRLDADEDLDRAIAAAMADRDLPADVRAILDEQWTALDADRHALARFLASSETPE